jgi:hypothetical protein
MWNCERNETFTHQEPKVVLERSNPPFGSHDKNVQSVEKSLQMLAKTQEQHEKALHTIANIPNLTLRIQALQIIVRDLTQVQTDIYAQVNCLFEKAKGI